MTKKQSMHEEQDIKARIETLTNETLAVAQRWARTPYYDSVEARARAQWSELILPFFDNTPINTSHVLELAVGHGRMTEILLQQADRVTGVDVLQENIDFCLDRFKGNPKLKLLKNDGVRLNSIKDADITFVFCFDSMIHFDSDVVRNYLSEFYRIMAPGAYGFLHHSNLSKNPGGNFQRNAHARNFMSAELFSHYSQKEGLEVVKQKILDWGSGDKKVTALDGFTMIRRP